MPATIFLLAPNSSFMTDSLYLSTIQIWRNLNEHCYCLTSTKSVIWQIVANCSPLQALDMLPFQIRLERLKLIYYGLMSIFSKILLWNWHSCLLFLSSQVFIALEFDGNHFDILLWKIVKPRDHNEIKPPIRKAFRKYNLIRHYFVMSRI